MEFMLILGLAAFGGLAVYLGTHGDGSTSRTPADDFGTGGYRAPIETDPWESISPFRIHDSDPFSDTGSSADASSLFDDDWRMNPAHACNPLNIWHDTLCDSHTSTSINDD